ncbi:hypothetical protein [Elioraea thermophila]|uniref:hypothetical protein n=1 Tax=Elioraea thermophila TaxID=2185104 RepID=UPI000DF2ABF6|nr:hypothetical protein [Elioraea thermophila]
MPTVLKLSPQRQLTLSKALVETLGRPRFFEVELRAEARELVLRPADKLTLEEAEVAYGRHGITRAVLIEALRIVRSRERAEDGG